MPAASFGTEAPESSDPVLRIVHNLNNPPLKFVDSNGQGAGLLPDLWCLWAEKNGRKVEFIAAPWGKTLQMVRDGEADIHAGLFYSRPRDEYLDFSSSLFNLEYQVFVHDTVRDVHSLKDLSGFRIGVPKGYTRNYMSEQLPEAALAVYENFPALYDAAMRDEIRIFVSPRFNYSDFLRLHKQKEYQRFFPAFSLYNRDYLGAVAEGKQKLLAEINQGMMKITAQERAAIEHKWLMPGEETLVTDTLRISMSASYHPLTFLDGDGEPGGFLVELWRLWSEKTGRKVTFLPSTWKESVDAIASRKADIHSGLMKNKKRSQWLLFSDPVHGLSSRFYFSADESPVQTLADITTQRAGAVRGTWQLDYLKKHLSETQTVAFDNSANMITALRQGRINVIFDEDLTMDKALDRQRLRGLIYRSRHPVTRQPVFAGVLKKNQRLIAEINEGFNQITTSELLELEQRWITDPSSRFYSTTEPSVSFRLSDSEKAWLAEHQSVRVGAIADWAPIDFVNTDGVQRGITADYLKLIEKQLKLTFLLDSKVPWAKMLEQAENKKTDIVANIVKTEARSQYLHFSTPYLNCPYAIVSRRNHEQTIEGVQDLNKKTVAVEKGYFLHARLREDYPDLKLLSVDSTLHALEAVADEKADAYIGNRAVISWLIEQQQLRDLKISGDTGFAPTLLRFGVRKDWPELASILNKALDTITQAEHRAIRKKWLGADEQNVSELFQHIQVTQAEQVWLDTLEPLRLGTDSNWAPLEYMDDNEKYSGMSSDYMQRFTRQLGLKMASVEKMTWPEVLDKARAKELDIIPMIVPTSERSEYLNFTKPYIDFPLAVFTSRDSSLITGLEDLSGKRLAVEKGYMTFEYLKRDYPDLEIVEVPTTLAALEAVSYGQADAFVGNLLTGSYLIDHEGLSNVKIAAPTPYRSTLSIGVRKDWPLLIPLLNRAIDSLTDTDRAGIRHNWLTVRYDQRMDYSLIWKIVAGSVLIIMLVLWRNRELNRRREQLEASEKQFKALINTLPVAIVVVDRGGTIIFDNAQAGREIGNEKSLVGRTSEEFYASADDRSQVLALVAQKGQVVAKHVKYRIDSGEIIDCLLSVIPIRFDGQDALLAVTVNVTERVRMEQALEKAKTHAEEADHLKSAFLASMSHELRTPLNSIIGFTGILLQQLAGPLNGEQNKQLSMVQTSSRHLLALINDVLDISKIEAGELEISCVEFDMRKSIEKVVQIVEPMAAKQGLSLRVDISPEVGSINSDQKRVEQILINLLGNSIKFTDAGEVAIRCRIENELLLTDVSDTGSGIKPKDMDKLFQTFKQIDTGVNRVHEGTGLGLSISKKLVEKLGGSISVKSEWGAGSTFSFTIPPDGQTELDNRENS